MMIVHNLSLDMMRPSNPERIQVKQGDTMSRSLELQLFCDGEPWLIPGEATPLVRWRATDPDTGETAAGVYDTLPNGSHAWNAAQNQLDLVLTPQMFLRPGLVQADVVLVTPDRTLATFNFEFYVNRSPVEGTEPQAENFYKVFTLEQINKTITELEDWQVGIEEILMALNYEIQELRRSISGL